MGLLDLGQEEMSSSSPSENHRPLVVSKPYREHTDSHFSGLCRDGAEGTHTEALGRRLSANGERSED